MPRWVTIEAAADYLSVHPRTLRRRINEGAFPASRTGPRDIRVDLDDVDAWLSGNRVEESA